MPTPADRLYWKLSSFYLFFFASVGAFVPYWGLYLKETGYSPAQIGELMAVVMATKIVAPNVWGWIADHFGHRTLIIRLGALAALLCFAGVTLVGGYWWLAAVLATFSFFWHAVLPQFEAVTMTHLGDGTHRYSHIRLWGSVGFIIAVAALAPLFQAFGVMLLPWVVLLLLALVLSSSFLVEDRALPATTAAAPGILRTLTSPAILWLMAACFLMQASHGPYYTFLTIYLEGEGYSRSLVGQLWALGVIAEVGVFLMMHRWLPRFGAWPLLMTAIGITALRWVLIALYADVLPVLIFAQTLHAASYGLYHASAIDLVHRLFPGRQQGRGQALYSSMSFGLGGAVGSLMAGYAWTAFGGTGSYLAAAGLASFGLAAAWRGARSDQARV
ncbi:MAG: MFS transporter [Ectothiorhodospiraceae bacterium]|jgi:PPP family 3-phenylpropionic acid transporter|nr:MFS transporter [Ectothiorhodospiraceae bacterium]